MPASLPRLVLRRAAIALGVLGFMVAGYEAVGWTRDPAAAVDLRTAWDDAVPFVPASVYVYSWVYTSMLYPAFVVRDDRLFRRVALAYLAVLAVAIACFVLVPVTSAGLRAPAASLDASTLAGWAVRLTYRVDPPWNLFPSLHLAIALLAAMSAWSARRLFGALALPMVAGIAVSICTMKQHFLLDGVAGLALGASAWALVVRPAGRALAGRDGVAFSWRGPAAYLAFHAAFYAAFAAAFLAGAG